MESDHAKNTFYITTFGCTYNTADSDKMKQILVNSGYEQTDIYHARIIIINTCAVKLPTEQKLLTMIKRYSRKIDNKSSRITDFSERFEEDDETNPDDSERDQGRLENVDKKNVDEKEILQNAEILIVAGCLPFISKPTHDRIRSLLPKRSGIISPRSISEIKRLIDLIESGEEKPTISEETAKEKELIIPYIDNDQFTVAIQIAEGCSGNCSYCCTKIARGKLCSFSIEAITNSVKELLEKGIKEFYITAQDLGAYNDKGKKLHDLLSSILQLNGDFHLRLGMMNPEYLKNNIESIIELLKDKRIYRFIHIPVQSGSDAVLKAMRRRYNIQEFNEVIKRLKEFDENISISTDIICGFPTETEQDWNETVNLVENIQPAVLNISKYTVRPNTEAKKMVQLKSKIIKNRSSELTEKYERIAAEIGSRQIGKEVEVFVSEKNPKIDNNYTARNLYYHSIIVRDVELGKRYNVKITDYKSHYYLADVLNEIE